MALSSGLAFDRRMSSAGRPRAVVVAGAAAKCSSMCPHADQLQHIHSRAAWMAVVALLQWETRVPMDSVGSRADRVRADQSRRRSSGLYCDHLAIYAMDAWEILRSDVKSENTYGLYLRGVWNSEYTGGFKWPQNYSLVITDAIRSLRKWRVEILASSIITVLYHRSRLPECRPLRTHAAALWIGLY